MKGKKTNFWLYVFFAVLAIAAIFLSVLVFSKPLERFTNASAKSLEYFYMPSCPHCQDFNPVWDELETEVSSKNVGVQCKKHNLLDDDELGKKYSINAAPTIIFIHENGDVKEYKGPREVKAIMSFIKDEVQSTK